MFRKVSFLLSIAMLGSGCVLFFGTPSALAIGENCFCYTGKSTFTQLTTPDESTCNTTCSKQGNGVEFYQYNGGGYVRVGAESLSALNCFCYTSFASITADPKMHAPSEGACNSSCTSKSDVSYYTYGDAMRTSVGRKQCVLSNESIGIGAVAKALLWGGTVPTIDGGNLPSDADCLQACITGGYKSYSYNSAINLMHNCSGSNSGSTAATTTATPGAQISNNDIPGVAGPASELVKCGRSGGKMCTLCDLIAGLNYVIKYIMKISIGLGLMVITIAGIMYIVSAGDSGMTGMAKTAMKNVGIGFIVIFGGWVIINTVIQTVGSRTDAQGNPTFGMNITSWGKFDCSAKTR